MTFRNRHPMAVGQEALRKLESEIINGPKPVYAQCDCDKGAAPKGKQANNVIARIPTRIFVQIERNNQMVTLDRCIAGVIYHLWDVGIPTLGCCCGHGKASPCVIVDEALPLSLCDAAYEQINFVFGDKRVWQVMQWRPVTLDTPPGDDARSSHVLFTHMDPQMAGEGGQS